MRLPPPEFGFMPFGGYNTFEVQEFRDRIDRATRTDQPSITAAEIRAVRFSTVRAGGYTPTDVDDWQEQVAAIVSGEVAPPPEPRWPAPTTAPEDRPPTIKIDFSNPFAHTDVRRRVHRPPDPTARSVGLVRQSRSIPQPVLLLIIAVIVTTLVLVIYVAG